MSRTYNSPTREEQARRTRATILDSLIEVLVDGGPAAVSVPAVAKRAGVSVRSVYHHFPSKDALVNAIGEAVDARLGDRPMRRARSARELAESLPEAYDYLARNRSMMQAMVMSGVADRIGRPASVRRGQRVDNAIGPLLSRLDQPHRERLRALVQVLASFEGYRALTDAGLSTDDAAEAAGWAIQVLCERAGPTGATGQTEPA